MKLIKLIDPNRITEKRAAKVHYQDPTNTEALFCGHGSVYREVDGEKFRVWQETKRPVNCSSCTTRVEGLLRFQLRGLNAEQYEDLLAHVDTFRTFRRANKQGS